jgi:ADP-ribosylglycohydrolase
VQQLEKSINNVLIKKWVGMTKVTKDKYISCLLGGAIGDALGAPVEFLTLSQIRKKYGPAGINDYVEFSGQRGEFTDDTQMTLFSAEALLRACHRAMLKGIGGALTDIAHHSYLRWLFTQNIGIDTGNLKPKAFDETGWLVKQKGLYKQRAPGNTCIMSLSSGMPGTIEKPLNNSKGCGTIMRVAPVGLMFFEDAEQSFKVACELSAITHGHPTGYLSAGFFAAMISELAAGVNLMDAINHAKKILLKWNRCEETLLAVQAALDLFDKTKTTREDITAEIIEKLGQGWVAEEALSISIYSSLLFENDFENGILFAVNHNGDSDSTGSITGNLLGLINGLDAIPLKWIDHLTDSPIVIQVAEDLHQRVKGDTFNPDDDWWNKYPGF